MDKHKLSESDISDKFVRPAMVQAGWHTLDQIYAQFPLRAGRVVVRGKTAKLTDSETPAQLTDNWHRISSDQRKLVSSAEEWKSQRRFVSVVPNSTVSKTCPVSPRRMI